MDKPHWMRKLKKRFRHIFLSPSFLHTSRRGREYDELTGLDTRRHFLKHAGAYLDAHRHTGLCMVCADIDHFTLYNQSFGRDAGDRYLQFISRQLHSLTQTYGGVAGYFGADCFYYLCPDRPELFAEIEETALRELRSRDLEVGYAVKCGVYRVTDPAASILDICDRAKAALDSIRKDYSHLIAWYDPSMERSARECRLIREVESGLREREFTFYLQPKCNMLNGKVVGAEALVRWFRKDGTVVRPDHFVPLLEEQGLISRIDGGLWEAVCRYQRECLDRGRDVLPISVNISQSDFYQMDVADRFGKLMEKYALPMDCLELEITESSFAGKSLQGEVSRLKELGFRILMDDFGSGYSSLNSLKEIDVDVLKIDMHFLDTVHPEEWEASDVPEEGGGYGKIHSWTREKGGAILEGVANMANAMRLPLIVEGVETAGQVRFLTSIHCLYAQGYYYYAPISQEVYDDILSDPGKLDNSGLRSWDAERELLSNLSELLHGDPWSRVPV